MIDLNHRPPDAGRPDDEHTIRVQALFVQHTSSLRGFVNALAPDFTITDDVIQETFLTVTQKAHEFQFGTNFWGWVCTIARYKVLEHLRGGRHAPQPLADQVLDSLCAVLPNPEEDDARLRLLAGCLEKLSPKSRRIIELRYWQAHTSAEIARLLGWGPESVYVALARARKLLRDCVERRFAGLAEE